MPERRKSWWSDRSRENQRTPLAFGVLIIAILAIILALIAFL